MQLVYYENSLASGAHGLAGGQTDTVKTSVESGRSPHAYQNRKLFIPSS